MRFVDRFVELDKDRLTVPKYPAISIYIAILGTISFPRRCKPSVKIAIIQANKARHSFDVGFFRDFLGFTNLGFENCLKQQCAVPCVSLAGTLCYGWCPHACVRSYVCACACMLASLAFESAHAAPCA